MNRVVVGKLKNIIKALGLWVFVAFMFSWISVGSVLAATTVEVINRNHLKENDRNFVDSDTDDNFNYIELQPSDSCRDTIKGFENSQLRDTGSPSSAEIIFDTPNSVNTGECTENEDSITFSHASNFSIAFVWFDENTIRTTDGKMRFERDGSTNIFKDAHSEDRCLDTLTVSGSFPEPTTADLQERELEEGGNHEYAWFPFSISDRTKNNSNGCNESDLVRDVKIGAVDNEILADDENAPPPPAPPPPCADGAYVDNNCTSFNTAFGNVGTNPGAFIAVIFGILLSVSGGIALLLIMRAGYKIMTSQGNPEAIKEGREQLIAAIVGLLFLIFAFVFLQLFVVDILRIPGIGNPAATIPVPGGRL